ncbi:hypothetical protein BDV12DRAFT_206984 [Aspergillus spectabilis]
MINKAFMYSGERKDERYSACLQALWQQLPGLALRLASKHRPGHTAAETSDLIISSSAVNCFVKFEDNLCVIVRFAIPCSYSSHFCNEKSSDEISVMRYLARTTIIPVPAILDEGTWNRSSYNITQHIKGSPLSNRLRPSLLLNSKPELERVYHCMAQVMLELSKPTFPQIGALVQFPNKTFTTASEYFTDLATQQLHHLHNQRDTGLLDADDWKEKYIARCMFRPIARTLSTEPGPFRLYCDDFSPANILVSPDDNTTDDFTVVGVTNWEFTYVAPNEFTYTAPWWLLFQTPHGWEQDLLQFQTQETPYLNLFLRVLRSCEDREIQKGAMEDSQRLSCRMADSMDNGLFWFCLAVRKSYLFDDIYWTYLDRKFFAPFASLDDRLELLSVEEREDMEGFVMPDDDNRKGDGKR